MQKKNKLVLAESRLRIIKWCVRTPVPKIEESHF